MTQMKEQHETVDVVSVSAECLPVCHVYVSMCVLYTCVCVCAYREYKLSMAPC